MGRRPSRRRGSQGGRPSGARGPRGRPGTAADTEKAEPYTHPEADLAARPEIGIQSQFRKKKPSKTYKYDSSLAPELRWDGENAAREEGEALIREILDAESLQGAKLAADKLAKMSRPFLNWSGKAERLSFHVPTLPLFIHERLSTEAILETLKLHRRDQQTDMFDLFGARERPAHEQIMRAYEHRDTWVNRLILGDSLVVMNSLLEYEGLGGQVQMIYIDPPYGVRFGSNFQPFVRRRDVRHNDDAHLTREPEMVQAYRDTWELGVHSYLTYLRERLLIASELLAPSGSVFLQISDQNLHHARELLDEIFGPDNFAALITFRKTAARSSELVAGVSDYLLWYCKDRSQVRFRSLFVRREWSPELLKQYSWIEGGGERRRMGAEEQATPSAVAGQGRLFRPVLLTSSHEYSLGKEPFTYLGRRYRPGSRYWSTSPRGLQMLADKDRLLPTGDTLNFVRYLDDFPFLALSDNWTDTATGGGADRFYAVQTTTKVIARCMLMTTDPGDLVLDPTCGSGTTAFVAEAWGRRWITIDTSRVPLALVRQRLLTGAFPWYELKDERRGPAGGFVYERRKNRTGEDVGGIVPHVTLKSLANDEPPKEEVLVDRPEIVDNITRVTGPFVVEATIPTPVDFEADGVEDSSSATAEEHASFVERMLETIRRNPVLHLPGNRTVRLRSVRQPARALSLSVEALVDASAPGQQPSLTDVADEAEEKRGDRFALSGKRVAIVFGPENGAVSDKLVFNAAKEANVKGYTHLYVIGFAAQPEAREAIEKSANAYGIAATYVQAAPDLMMGDLLKTMRSSQIFSVCGLPEIQVVHKPGTRGEPDRYQVHLLGVDTFDPITMEVDKLEDDEIPAWFLDTNYNDLCFHVTQAFFPKTGAWESLKRALRVEFEESVWEHLNGTVSAPFEAAADRKIAVKVIDNRGNELMVVKTIAEALR